MRSVHKLVANVMTASDSRKSKPRMHYKQCLNSFHEIDKLLKKFTNDKSKNNKIVSIRNNLNISPIEEDINARGPTRHLWEANNHREKGMQLNKENFASQKGNFSEILPSK